MNDEGLLEETRYDGLQDRIEPDGLMHDTAIFQNLLGSLEDRECRIWAHCLFVDPVGDLAILASCDNQRLPDESDAYEEWIEKIDPIRIGRLREQDKQAFVFSLKGEWIPVSRLSRMDYLLMTHNFVVEDASPIDAGMSGSPLLTADGRAIALISTISTGEGASIGAAPLLVAGLPGWLVESLF